MFRDKGLSCVYKYLNFAYDHTKAVLLVMPNAIVKSDTVCEKWNLCLGLTQMCERQTEN